MHKNMRTLLVVGMFIGNAVWAGPLDPPAKGNATPPPRATPFTGSNTTLSQPDRLQPADKGPGVMTGNPLNRGPIASAKTITGTTLRIMPEGRMLFAIGNETVMITGLPADFLVKDGTFLKIKVHPTKTLAQYRTYGATATVDSYMAVEVPKTK